MPIEFRCDSCSKLLRTPDESGGKKAKCPQCGAIVDVPATDSAATSEFPQPFSARPEIPADSTNPFAAMGGVSRTPEDDNPYASPSLNSDVQEAKTSTSGELTHHTISFEDLLSTCWSITMDNLGPMAIFGVVVFGIRIAVGILNQGIVFGAQVSGNEFVVLAAQLFTTALNVGFQTWIGIVSVLYCIRLARNRRAELDVLSQSGPYFLRALGLTLLIAGIFLLLLLVLCGTPALVAWIATRDPAATAISALIGGAICVIPSVVIAMNFLLSLFFLVDRQAGVFAALGLSRQFMSGNKMTAFFIILVVNILGGLFVIFTCCAGQIIYEPFKAMMMALIYLTATGQAYQKPLQ